MKRGFQETCFPGSLIARDWGQRCGRGGLSKDLWKRSNRKGNNGCQWGVAGNKSSHPGAGSGPGGDSSIGEKLCTTPSKKPFPLGFVPVLPFFLLDEKCMYYNYCFWKEFFYPSRFFQRFSLVLSSRFFCDPFFRIRSLPILSQLNLSSKSFYTFKGQHSVDGD